MSNENPAHRREFERAVAKQLADAEARFERLPLSVQMVTWPADALTAVTRALVVAAPALILAGMIALAIWLRD